MAIEDNKDYALKGSQIKDLSEKVKAKAEQADTYTKAEVDGLIPDVSDFVTGQELTDGLALKADKATTYTKTEVDGLIPDVSVLATKTELSEGLADKADADTTYTKTEVDTALATKADTSTTYTKTEVDTALSAKADTATTYTKTEVDDLLDANKEVLVAVYEQTSYADVKAAIDAHKAIVLDMPANNNQFCMTFSTYTNGGDVIMYAIFKMSNDRSTLMTVTLTPQNQWRISHTDLQDKLVSGTSIKTINNQSLLGSGNINIQGTGNADFNLDTTNDFAVIQSQTQGMSFDLSDADGVTVTASDPGIYINTKVLATQDYVDGLVDEVGLTIDTTNPCSFNEFTAAFGQKPVWINGLLVVGYVDEDTSVHIYTTPYKTNVTAVNYWTYNFTSNDHTQPMVYNSRSYSEMTPDFDTSVGSTRSSASIHRDNDWFTMTHDSSTDLVDTRIKRGVSQLDFQIPTKDYVDAHSGGVNFAVGQERWYGTYTDENNVTYQTYSKTIFIPALPSAAGITTYPIGVTNIKQIIDIFGTTTDGFKLNAPRQTVSDNITIYQVSKGSQTFSIEVGKDRSNKSAYVTIIYAKNN